MLNGALVRAETMCDQTIHWALGIVHWALSIGHWAFSHTL
jgi:hypothetical protein